MLNYDDKERVLNTHKKLGHPGALRTFKTLKLKFGFKLPYNKVAEILNSCLDCRKNIIDKTKYGKIEGIVKSDRPLQTISSDIVGPFKNSIYNLNPSFSTFYFLTITDIFSRYSEIYFLKEITSSNIINKCFKLYFKKHSIPKNLISDNGRQYVSIEFKNYLDKLGIKHIKTSAYNPTSNGISERINQTIIKVLKIFKGNTIKKITILILKNLNQCYNTAIQNFPEKILDGYKNDKYQTEIEKVKQLNELKRQKTLENINKNRKDFDFKIDDMVLHKNHLKGKLESKYEGPYLITRVFNNKNIVEIEKQNGLFRVNIKNIKPYQA
ncbi:Transposon Tf2-6 polyprotein [Dictyocoela roeselum]|nr:Transposon Tf2-6 polyprotein [Dictyocoela roeselum]